VAKARIAKKGAGGLIESLAKKAERGYLKEITQGKTVTKAPTSKFDRTRAQEERAYEKGHGLTDEERRVDAPEDFGEYDRGAHSLSLEETEALDDKNASKEAIRKFRSDTAPVLTKGKEPPEVEFPEKYVPGKKWKGIRTDKRGGGIELGKVGGSKSKRRMDKKAR
jgi:hypothetical protein